MKSQFKFQNPLSEKIWNALQCIPEEVLEDYLADNILDEQEIDDVSARLADICQKHNLDFNIDDASRDLIRQLVHQAVHAIRNPVQASSAPIEKQLNNVTLNDVRSVMGNLLQSGQIMEEAQHLSRADKVSYGEIPGDDDDDNLYTG